MLQIALPMHDGDLARANSYMRARLPAAWAARALHVELAMEEILLNISAYSGQGGAGYEAGHGAGPKSGEEAGQEAGQETGQEVGGRAVVELRCGCTDIQGVPFFLCSFKDWGLPYDPFTETPAPVFTDDAASRQMGGLGVHLVKQCAQHYCYSRQDGANIVELYFASCV